MSASSRPARPSSPFVTQFAPTGDRAVTWATHARPVHAARWGAILPRCPTSSAGPPCSRPSGSRRADPGMRVVDPRGISVDGRSRVWSVPDASDPSFAREERRARARRAAAEASAERQQELRSRYAPPAPHPEGPTRTGGRVRSERDGGSFDVAAVAASARAALDAHPSTWTSYAELCAANGLDRGLSPAVARRLTPGSAGQHWFRIRSNDGVYDLPRDDASPRRSQAEADRALEAIGVRVLSHRADPERKLLWMHGEWCLAGR
jgi:hypothetical protein